ncbi:glutamine-hydrolyzing carbamoyl-phosphate synthase small subunit [bacterium]|nr:glutamine-hydrolyzing carbamoyl-phosphate synthase small subunit [bacterium]
MRARLLLEDGSVFSGEGFGARATAIGEVVFNTGMTGYQEILSDPSYKGQMVTMTCPHIGNTGINKEDVESYRPHVEGLIVREFCPVPSNYRSERSLEAYLSQHDIPGIHGIDTRALTRHIRDRGAMMGILSNDGTSAADMKKRLAGHPGLSGRDMVSCVTLEKSLYWNVPVQQSWYFDPIGHSRAVPFRVAAFDFGVKWNILRLLSGFGMAVTVLPASTPADKVKEMKPDGIFLSNGPGDPEAVTYAIASVQKLARHFPVFGICLGHQIIGLAFGARTFKLKFGHHGSNHPVRNETTRSIEITSQNHNYAVEPESAKKTGFDITHWNLNDGTVEGMRHRDLPVFSVQYHPEASPGPHDSLYLFNQFLKMME